MKISVILALSLSAFIVGCGSSNSIPEEEKTELINTVPVASNPTIPLAVSTETSFTLTATDADNDPIVFEKVSNPKHGKITKFNRENGTFTYVPEEGYKGKDTFQYRVSDGVSRCAAKTVTIDVQDQSISKPLAPSDLKAKPACSCAAKLTWKDNSNNEDGFEIYKNGKLICVKGADETSATISKLSAATTYTFEVKAKNASGKSSPVVVQFTTQGVKTKPAAPTQLEVISKNDKAVRLKWKDNANNESGYEIYKNGVLLKVISPSCSCTMIGDLDPNESYTFEVKAVNDLGASAGEKITVTMSDSSDDSGTGDDSGTAENKAPEVTTDSNKVITIGDTIALDSEVKDSDGSIVKYEWKEGANILSDKKGFNYTPTTAGDHFLIVTVTDDDGATASAPVKVVVKEKVDPEPENKKPIAEAGADKSTTVNKAVTLIGNGSDSDGTIASYKWTENGVVLATTKTFSYTPTTVGVHTLTLTVTDNDGATASDTVKVTAKEAADTTKPVIALKGDSTVNLTVGEAYTDAGATANDNKDGDITSKVVKSGTVDTATAGTYTVKYNVTDAAGNEADEVTRTVIVSDPYATWSVGKDNEVHDLTEDLADGNIAKVLIEKGKEIGGDETSLTTDGIKIYINGNKVLFFMNENYDDGMKLVVRVYNSSGKIIATSNEAVYNGDNISLDALNY